MVTNNFFHDGPEEKCAPPVQFYGWDQPNGRLAHMSRPERKIRRAVRELSDARVARLRRPPQLRFVRELASSRPRIYYLCPDTNVPTGGIRTMYRHVDVLNSAGLPSAIVHSRAGFACSWFDHDTAVTPASSVRLGHNDVVMVPEFYDHRLLSLPTAVRIVIFNQNTYRTFHDQHGELVGSLPWGSQKVEAILVVSQDNLQYASYAFPDIPVKRVRLAVNRDVFYASAEIPGRRIAVMPRRRTGDCRQVLTLLALRGLLSSWQVVAIDGHSERETADLLRSCSIFLSFSEQEGFGLPPAEAMACGCYVVGFTGQAGREYFHAGTSIAVEEGNVLAMAKAVEGTLEAFNKDPLGIRQRGLAASSRILGDYSPEAERADLLSFVQSLPCRYHLSHE
jgi:hypothetical protein